MDNRFELEKRKMSTNTCWYEYGRSQALSSVLKKKLVIPKIISGKIHASYSGENEIPYAGYYIEPITDALSLEDALKIIESKEFFEYGKVVGTPTTKDSYRLSVTDILKYPLG